MQDSNQVTQIKKVVHISLPIYDSVFFLFSFLIQKAFDNERQCDPSGANILFGVFCFCSMHFFCATYGIFELLFTEGRHSQCNFLKYVNYTFRLLCFLYAHLIIFSAH